MQGISCKPRIFIEGQKFSLCLTKVFETYLKKRSVLCAFGQFAVHTGLLSFLDH